MIAIVFSMSLMVSLRLYEEHCNVKCRLSAATLTSGTGIVFKQYLRVDWRV